MAKKNFHLTTTDTKVSVVTFDATAKMNMLAAKVLKELAALLDEVASDGNCRGLVFISGKKDQFIVGADVNEIETLNTPEQARDSSREFEGILRKFSQLKIPTVAAIHGPCLGGGLELILCCTYRIASDAEITKFAAPEIKLGLIPGAGGTQRLPRLVGISTALDLILTGRNYPAHKAMKVGLVDAIVPQTMLAQIACDYAVQKKPPVNTRKKKNLKQVLPEIALQKNPLGRKLMARKAREAVARETRSFYPAAYKALEAVFDGIELPLNKGLELEAQLFSQLVCTRECKSLIHLFHATTALKKNNYSKDGKAKYGDTKVERLGIVGAGFMGAGLATLAADRHCNVLISDPNAEAVGKLLKHANVYFAKKVQRQRLKRFQQTQKMAMITPGTTIAGFNSCQLVIEAVYEKLELKQQILQACEEQLASDMIFASNTSALSIAAIAAQAKNPERVLGMHFFSPVEKMPLLEIVVTKKTAPWAISRAVDFGHALGKQVIIVQDQPGFYTTRVLAFLMAEALRILLEGGPIEEIDKALTDFGFPVGPITLVDEVGIDIGLHVLDTLTKHKLMEAPPLLDVLPAQGYLGRKAGKGFFQYRDGKKLAVDENIYKLLDINKKQDELPHDLIVDRCLLLFVNEAVKCLDTKILSTPRDGDVGAVFGLGFPPFWGGPFKYVDHVGCKAIVENLHTMQNKYGQRFAPAQGLVTMAEQDTKFFS